MVEDYSHTFKVEKLLGRGTFGSVYLVKSREDKEYALKVIHSGTDGQLFTDSIWQELTVMSEMKHRNIVKVYGAYQSLSKNGSVRSIAIQIEYCPKGDLGHYLVGREGRLLTSKRLTSWMADLASAIAYMHSLRILHRDLKPENILLNVSDVLKVSDFGIARFAEGCQANTIIGTPLFLAPEVLAGQGYNEKADIFSLGLVFVCMATVKPKPVDLSFISDVYNDAVHNLIRRCASNTPERRPTARSVHMEAQMMASNS